MIIKLGYFFVGLVIKLYIKLYTSVNYLKFSNFFRNVSFMLTRILLMSKFYSFLFFAILLFIYTFVVFIIFFALLFRSASININIFKDTCRQIIRKVILWHMNFE